MSRLVSPPAASVGDAALGRGQRGGAGQGVRARPRAGGVELGAHVLGQPARGARDGELQRAAQRLAGVRGPALAAQRGAERGERVGELQPRGRALERRDGLLEPGEAGGGIVVELERAEHAQRPAERARGAPRPRQLQLLAGARERLVAAAEPRQRGRDERAPRRGGRVRDLRVGGLDLLRRGDRRLVLARRGEHLEPRHAPEAHALVAGHVPRAAEHRAGALHVAAADEDRGEDAVEERERARVAEAPHARVLHRAARLLLRAGEVAARVEGVAAPHPDAVGAEQRAVAVRLGPERVELGEPLLAVGPDQRHHRRDRDGAALVDLDQLAARQRVQCVGDALACGDGAVAAVERRRGHVRAVGDRQPPVPALARAAQLLAQRRVGVAQIDGRELERVEQPAQVGPLGGQVLARGAQQLRGLLLAVGEEQHVAESERDLRPCDRVLAA